MRLSIFYKTSLNVWLIFYQAEPTRQTHTYTMTVCFGKTLYVSSTANGYELSRLHRLMLSCTARYTTAPSTILLYIMNTLMCPRPRPPPPGPHQHRGAPCRTHTHTMTHTNLVWPAWIKSACHIVNYTKRRLTLATDTGITKRQKRQMVKWFLFFFF